MTGENGLFLYGIVPSDVEPEAQASGIGDPPVPVEIVRHGELAVLVSEIEVTGPIGHPEDLTAYQRLLDGTATVAPVLPMRFGTVVTGRDAVIDLLNAHQDRFLAALAELEGRVEYVMHGRYQEDELITRVLNENPAAAELARQVRGQPEETTRQERIRLGEIISQAVELRREADNRYLVEALAPFVVANVPRPPSHEYDAANVAFLVDLQRQSKFIEVVEGLAEQWQRTVRFRLLGPMAPYDFVNAHQLTG